MLPLKHEPNNFDFLRLTAAMLVLYSHQFALLGQSETGIVPTVSWGSLGVYIFFTISGYLVTQSWTRAPNACEFITRRFLRIWPGLFAMTCLLALVIGPLVSTLSYWDYFQSAQTYDFFSILKLNIQYYLPGVFSTNTYPNAVNGSLWTIPIEINFYAMLLIAGIVRLLNFKWAILTGLIAIAIYHFGVCQAGTNASHNYFIEFGLYFIYGVVMQLFRPIWAHQTAKGYIAVGAMAIIFCFTGHAIIGLWIALPYLVIAFGAASTPVVRRFGRFGDISYGVYIYAFPMQQLIIHFSAGRLTLPVCLLLSMTATAVCAFASWHWVEKPAMQFKPKSTLVAAE